MRTVKKEHWIFFRVKLDFFLDFFEHMSNLQLLVELNQFKKDGTGYTGDIGELVNEFPIFKGVAPHGHPYPRAFEVDSALNSKYADRLRNDYPEKFPKKVNAVKFTVEHFVDADWSEIIHNYTEDELAEIEEMLGNDPDANDMFEEFIDARLAKDDNDGDIFALFWSAW